MFVLFRTLHFGAISWCTGELFLLTKGTGTFLNLNLVGKSIGMGVVAAYCRKEERREEGVDLLSVWKEGTTE